MNEGAGGADAAKPLFYYIGNCVKNRAASTEWYAFATRFGSRSGYGPLFHEFFLQCTQNAPAAVAGGKADVI